MFYDVTESVEYKAWIVANYKTIQYFEHAIYHIPQEFLNKQHLAIQLYRMLKKYISSIIRCLYIVRFNKDVIDVVTASECKLNHTFGIWKYLKKKTKTKRLSF